jgi:phosphopantothenoylcysteine synthetase/decarboxylase
MGYALAAAGVRAGLEVVLISGPVTLPPPAGVTLVTVETAQQMWEAVRAHTLPPATPPDIAIFAAAVADYRPRQIAPQKLKKQAPVLTLELERTPDILGSMREDFAYTGYLVGFAAETEDMAAHASGKLQRKGCDLVIANDVSRRDTGFDSAENEVMLCLPSGETELLPKQSKQTLAHDLVRRITLLAALPLSSHSDSDSPPDPISAP